jgi:hypothetical protein
MEDDHERRFAQLRSKVAAAFAPSPGDGADEVARYLAAIADGYASNAAGTRPGS